MGKIEKLLANLDKPKINKAFRENSKRRLVSYAKNETANELFIVKVLKEILNPLKVSTYLKTQVRQRLINLKRRKTLWEVISEIFEGSFVKILASWTIASLFFVNIIWFNTTSADIESVIFSNKWDVYIQHLWENWKKIYSNEILEIWDKIIIDDWKIVLIISEKNWENLKAIAKNSWIITSRRHINLPWKHIDLPILTESDKEIIKMWIENWIDAVAVSFVRNKEDILEVWDFIWDLLHYIVWRFFKNKILKKDFSLVQKVENKLKWHSLIDKLIVIKYTPPITSLWLLYLWYAKTNFKQFIKAGVIISIISSIFITSIWYNFWYLFKDENDFRYLIILLFLSFVVFYFLLRVITKYLIKKIYE